MKGCFWAGTSLPQYEKGSKTISDLLTTAASQREPLQASFSDASNPIGLDGSEFIEYATTKPQALGQVLEMMGFKPVAHHRSREVLLYRQGALNVVLNAYPSEVQGAAHGSEVSTISAIALRVHDVRAVYAAERGASEVPTPGNIGKLQSNIVINQYDRRVQAVHAACSDFVGQSIFL